MRHAISASRIGATAGLLAGCALLSGCFLQPGTFAATMDVRDDGRFTVTYDGEIVMAGMEELSEMAAQADGDAAEKPCVDDETMEVRECTADEIAQRNEEQAGEREMVRAMLGGMNPSDPQAAAALADSLERQAGWNSVEYRDDGVFEVSFAIDSRLGHDFDFPTIEGLPFPASFVQARLRDGQRVRIEAPGFAAPGGGNPLAAMMKGMAGAFGSGEETEDADAVEATQKPPLRPIEGTFRLTTDATILANNTDEGPEGSARGQMLVWDISPGTTIAPMALLQLAKREAQ